MPLGGSWLTLGQRLPSASMRKMSVRENLELYGGVDQEHYIQTLTGEYEVAEHPSQERAYVVQDLPFRAQREAKDHI